MDQTRPRRRSAIEQGALYHPQMAERFSDRAATILADLDRAPTWEAVLEVEPGPRPLSLPSQA